MPELLLPKHLVKAKEQTVFVYFENAARRIIIPPIADAQAPEGYQRHEIPTRNFREVESVSKRFNAQKKLDFEQADVFQQMRMDAMESKVRGALNTRLTQNISQFERDFIRIALKRMDEIRPKKVVRPEGHLTMEATEAPLSKA